MRCSVPVNCIADAQSFCSSSGSPTRTVYTPVLVDGSISLEPTGKEDIATKINSFADQTDMAVILSRLMAGDPTPLYAQQGFYGDFSQCTYDRAEMLRTVMAAHNTFDHLPDDIKHKFHDSFSDWFGSAGSPDWVKAMSASDLAADGSIVPLSVSDPVRPSVDQPTILTEVMHNES